MDVRGIGRPYNAATRFIDDNVDRGLGQKVAIYYHERQINYQDLKEMVNRAGNGLRDLGVEMENRVLILCHDSPEFIASFFGAIKIGAVPVPVNTMMHPKDYEYYLNNSRAKVIIAHSDLWSKIRHLRKQFVYLHHVIVIDGLTEEGEVNYEEWSNQSSTELSPAHTSSDDVAFWLFSSGSTGNPKGIIHLQHDMEYAYEHYAKNILEITQDDLTFSASPLFFAYGLGNGAYFPLGCGGATILMPGRSIPENVFQTIEKYRPTIFFGVPTLYQSMLNLDEKTDQPYDLSSVRICVSAGEPLPPSTMKGWKQRYNLDILDGIGSSEATHIFISNRMGDIKEGSTGKVVPGYEVKIADDGGRPLPPNEVGELFVKGDSLAHCYWNLHEENKRRFIGEWFKTGDKYYQDESGYFWYCGRSDDMIKAGGIWVSPIEIENVILQHDAISEVAVIGIPNTEGLEKPKAFIVLKSGHEPSEELKKELQQFVKKNLASYKYPRSIEFIDELPKTATGKIQRFKLRSGSMPVAPNI
jgi:benzoate-CoA ligase family protein